MKKLATVVGGGIFLLLASVAFANPVPKAADLPELDWWETTMFYQIYPRSFQDSDGDGIGDLKGIKSRLQHLKDTGIGATWLSPIYKSPQYDAGYDISDFYDINPEYGTMADFEELIAEANRLGIKIIMDFVPNHSSSEHEWFVQSLNKSSPYADWYIWEDGITTENGTRLPPNNWLSVFRKSAWEYSPERDQFYFHHFVVQQPDLNYRNPAVVEEMKNVLRFWLNKGIGGFRFDAVNHLFEVKKEDFDGVLPDEPPSGNTDDPDDFGFLNHIYTIDQEETYWMVYEWRKVFEEFNQQGDFTRIMMIEAYTSIYNSMKYYGNETSQGAQMPFNFGLISEVNERSSARDYKFYTDKWLTYMPQGKTANWVIGNHDQWRVGSRYGAKRIDGLNMIVLLLPGAGVTYQGEEFGMLNHNNITWEETQDPGACNTDDPINYWKVSRDPARTPMQWNSEKNAGFSTADKTWLPVNPNYTELNLEAMKAQNESTYQVYKDCVRLRKIPAFSHGRYESYAFNDDVFAFERSLKGYDTYTVAINTGNRKHEVDMTYFANTAKDVTVVVASNSAKNVGDGLNAEKLTLDPYESLVMKSA